MCLLDAASTCLVSASRGWETAGGSCFPTKGPWVLQPLQGNQPSCQTEPFTATQTTYRGILRNKLPMKQLVTEPGQSLACLLLAHLMFWLNVFYLEELSMKHSSPYQIVPACSRLCSGQQGIERKDIGPQEPQCRGRLDRHAIARSGKDP